MRCLPLALVLVALAALSSPPVEGAGEVLLDRVVASVDGDPILLSDIRRAIALGELEPAPDESRDELERRVLDGLIEQRLRYHEVERFDLPPPPPEAVEQQVESLRGRYSDAASWQRSLGRIGLDEASLRRLLGRQIKVLIYVEERLGPRVFVGREAIRTYYDDTFVPALIAGGEEPPPLADVSDDIRTLLREIALNDEIAGWTAELRQQADVVDLLSRDLEPLPPVVERIE